MDVADLAPSAEDKDRVAAGESLDLSIDVEGIARARVHLYRSNDGLAAALRILSREAPALSGLNMPVNLSWLVKLPHGLVIVCGPTGSGKSSTLAALARESMQQRARVLVSLEDPIEYRLQPGPGGGLVRQRQVGVDVPSFAAGLRDALREDPDVLLIGEMRDAETISLALTAAETGHLVFTSLHSRTAASAVERIVDTYPPERQRQIRVQLAEALRVVVSQRLLPRRGKGGRVPALEILKNTGAVANLIREGKTAQIVSAVQAGGEEGMLLLERCLGDLVRAQTVDVEAAKDAANDLNTLKHYLGRI
jgi:twitching motility protein PilT